MIYLGKSNAIFFFCHFAPDDLAAVGAYRHNFQCFFQFSSFSFLPSAVQLLVLLLIHALQLPH